MTAEPSSEEAQSDMKIRSDMPLSTIHLVDLQAQYAPIRDEVLSAISSVLDGMQITLGPNVSAFEQEYAAYCGATYCVGVANGTDALILALRAAGVEAGD